MWLKKQNMVPAINYVLEIKILNCANGSDRVWHMCCPQVWDKA